MNRNQRKLARASTELSRLVAAGRLVYSTTQQLATLRDLVALWLDNFGVELAFDPGTPAELQDYIAGAAIGAVEGACAGGMVGVVVGALLSAPVTGLLIGLGIGGIMGAAAGADAVHRGRRVRIHARWTALGSAVAVVELA